VGLHQVGDWGTEDIMTKGILFVVFGKGYDHPASVCVRESRKHTGFPFHVVSNMNRSLNWDGIKNLSWRTVNMSLKANRVPKVQAYKYSPFDRTIYLDCDAVIQREGVNRVFEKLNSSDVVMDRHERWERGSRVLRVYKRAMRQFGVKPPIDIWWGGLVAFNKSYPVFDFFDLWHQYWVKFGKARDMPCLACAVVNSPDLKVGMTPDGLVAQSRMNRSAVVQHFAAKDFLKKFGIESWEKNPPPTKRTDFKWTTWE